MSVGWFSFWNIFNQSVGIQQPFLCGCSNSIQKAWCWQLTQTYKVGLQIITVGIQAVVNDADNSALSCDLILPDTCYVDIVSWLTGIVLL